ncbi:LapA family protein [Curvivirga sp.]|uniref:LapA family protein n=1 Tax=Curvivirga sp. TaxID=2856848 RepID=UPI003B59F5AD
MRIINWILLFPLVLIAISFAVSNRGATELTLWPFPFSVEMPLVLFGFIMMLIGFLAGGFASWMAGQNKRKEARDTRKKANALDKEVQSLRSELKTEKQLETEINEAVLPVPSDTEKLPAHSKWSASN